MLSFDMYCIALNCVDHLPLYTGSVIIYTWVDFLKTALWDFLGLDDAVDIVIQGIILYGMVCMLFKTRIIHNVVSLNSHFHFRSTIFLS